jgi:hypothetical protein
VNDPKDVLEHMGLTKHEAEIYILLLKIGDATAVTLATKSGLHRRTAYDTLESLQKKGLVSLKYKARIRHFSPTNPDALDTMLRERQLALHSILPGLMNHYRSRQPQISINIYEGVEGMKIAFGEIMSLTPRQEVVMIGAGLKAPKHLKYMYAHGLDVLQRMKWRLIEPDTPSIRKEMESWAVQKNYRFLPAKYLSPLAIMVFKDKTLIALMEPEPLIIQITGKSYANAFRNYFEILWQVAR